MKKDILSMTLDELENLMTQLNEPKYRAVQIFEWLHRRGGLWGALTSLSSLSSLSPLTSFKEMDNLPKNLRAALEEHCRITPCQLVDTKTSSQDGTVKFLFALEGDVSIETVRMEYSFGNSICISTQAGCRMGCKFCASGSFGLMRNLTAGEMCTQIYAALSLSDNKKPDNNNLDNNNPDNNNPDNNNQADPSTNSKNLSIKKAPGIVLMGCGEPLDNFDECIRFLKLISHPKGAAIGGRHITISTCGLVPKIIELTNKLTELKLQVNLAISLHGPTDQIRKKIMPIANKYTIDELLEACKYHIKITNRRITFEYALIQGLTDQPSHAALLSKLLKGMLCHVNLIPVNPFNKNYSPTPRREAEIFCAILQKNNIKATIRRTIGSDVDAACGQLRAKVLNLR